MPIVLSVAILMSITVGIGWGAQEGIPVKSANALVWLEMVTALALAQTRSNTVVFVAVGGRAKAE